MALNYVDGSTFNFVPKVDKDGDFNVVARMQAVIGLRQVDDIVLLTMDCYLLDTATVGMVLGTLTGVSLPSRDVFIPCYLSDGSVLDYSGIGLIHIATNGNVTLEGFVETNYVRSVICNGMYFA